MSLPKVLNLFAGPGAGKSTTAAALFAELKYQGYNVELAPEYAKELVWLGKKIDQQDVFEVTSERLSIANKLDLLITDGPVFQQMMYTDNSVVIQSILNETTKYNNINVLLTRSSIRPYNPAGRYQTEEEAKALDEEIKSLLTTYQEDFVEFEFSRQTPLNIVEFLVEHGYLPKLK